MKNKFIFSVLVFAGAVSFSFQSYADQANRCSLLFSSPPEANANATRPLLYPIQDFDPVNFAEFLKEGIASDLSLVVQVPKDNRLIGIVPDERLGADFQDTNRIYSGTVTRYSIHRSTVNPGVEFVFVELLTTSNTPKRLVFFKEGTETYKRDSSGEPVYSELTEAILRDRKFSGSVVIDSTSTSLAFKKVLYFRNQTQPIMTFSDWLKETQDPMPRPLRAFITSMTGKSFASDLRYGSVRSNLYDWKYKRYVERERRRPARVKFQEFVRDNLGKQAIVNWVDWKYVVNYQKQHFIRQFKGPLKFSWRPEEAMSLNNGSSVDFADIKSITIVEEPGTGLD